MIFSYSITHTIKHTSQYIHYYTVTRLPVPDADPEICSDSASDSVNNANIDGASPQNACRDAPECAENGIEDEFACDIIPWAYDRCPVTCNTCPEETELSPQNKCQDAPECAENGIEDEFACEIIPWAYDRCPKTCGTCTEETDILYR